MLQPEVQLLVSPTGETMSGSATADCVSRNTNVQDRTSGDPSILESVIADTRNCRPSAAVLDLCCGDGGWADGFLAAGWIVYGVDVKKFPNYRGIQIVRDVRHLDPKDYAGAIDLVVASPPCTEFSKWDSRSLFPDMAEPSLELVKVCFEFARAAACPIVLENVRGLQKLIGQAVHHYGSFYLWGDVPPLMPKIPGRAGRPALKWKHRSPRLRARIPFELAYTVAQFHVPPWADRVSLSTTPPGDTAF